MLAESAVLEDRADHDPQVKCLLPCLQTYKHEVCQTIVLNFHLTCYKRIKGSCQHDETLQKRRDKE